MSAHERMSKHSPPVSASAALLVDDSPDVLAAMSLIVRRAGFVVTPCSSAAEGLAHIEGGERFALVVSDMRMPEMDGSQFRLRALEAWPDLDTVLAFVTGEPEQEWRAKIGSAMLFTKPVGEEFLAFARECLRRAKSPSEPPAGG